jgi:hypothetical protein
MYNSVIPDIDSSDDSGNDGSFNSKKVNGSISLFDIGERLAAGKGV